MSTVISVVGTVATDPRTITTQSGIALCTFRLACGERRFDREKNSWIDGETNWFTVTAFRGLARNASDSFHKGDRVIVNGRLRIRNWERDDRSGTAVDIEAEALGHDLRWGASSFTKRNGSETQTSTTSESAEHDRDRWAVPESAVASGSDSAESEQAEGAGHSDSDSGAMRTSTGEDSTDGFVPAAA